MILKRLCTKRTLAIAVAAAGAVTGAMVAPPFEGRTSAKAAMPDLIVREDLLKEQWVVRSETFSATACSVIEGGVQPGEHRVLRFTVTTPNIGSADINLGDPNAHVAAGDGLYELATCHRHYHFRHYALYQLIDPETGKIWRAAKRGFCMLDTDPNPAYYGQPARNPQFLSCGAVGVPGNQGISAGWGDTYRFFLAGQYFVLDGGDGQDPIPPGTYVIRITVNPAFVSQGPDDPCRFSDTNGFCHQLPESSYDNNVGQVEVVIPPNVGRRESGPLAGSGIAAVDGDEHER